MNFAPALPDFVTFGNGVRHCVYGHGIRNATVTFCGIYERFATPAFPGQGRRCKLCTRELRRTGMTWRWYESGKVQFRHEQAAKELGGNV